MTVLVDSTVLIDVLRQRRPAIAYLDTVRERLAASEVTRVEVLRGMRSDERGRTRPLLGAIDWLGVEELVAERAGEFGRQYRSSHSGIAVADLIIAATADVHALRLATSNVRHFPMFPDLEPAY